MPSHDLCAQLVGCDHILEAIMSHATTQTRGRCLSVNRRFFLYAGKALYTVLRIDSWNIDGVFKGALDGEPGFDWEAINAECLRVQDEDKGCLPKLPEGRSPYTGDSDMDSNEAFVDDEDYLPDSHNDTKEGGHSCRMSRCSSWASSNDEMDPKEEARRRKYFNHFNRERCPAGQPVQRRTQIPPKSLKAQLLAHVKILTVSGHSHSQCHIFGPYGADIFPNLDVLRIAPSHAKRAYLDELCYQLPRVDWVKPTPRVVCPLVAWLNPRKIVFRNVDCQGIIAPPMFSQYEWPCPRLEEVVFYLFPNDSVWHSEMVSGAAVDMHFHHAKRVKVVWLPDWEGADPDMDEELNDGLSFCEVMIVTAQFGRNPRNECVVYGLEKINFRTKAHDWLLHAFKKIYPHDELTNERLAKEVRHEFEHFTLSDYNRFDSLPKRTGKSTAIQYKTLDDYFADVEGRRGEFNADD